MQNMLNEKQLPTLIYQHILGVDIKLSVPQRECQDLAEFVRKVLGPYSSNVTTATRLCSASLCQGKGRCVRQNPDSSAYLHLPPPSQVVEKVSGCNLKSICAGFIQHGVCIVFLCTSRSVTPTPTIIHK